MRITKTRNFGVKNPRSSSGMAACLDLDLTPFGFEKRALNWKVKGNYRVPPVALSAVILVGPGQ